VFDGLYSCVDRPFCQLHSGTTHVKRWRLRHLFMWAYWKKFKYQKSSHAWVRTMRKQHTKPDAKSYMFFLLRKFGSKFMFSLREMCSRTSPCVHKSLTMFSQRFIMFWAQVDFLVQDNFFTKIIQIIDFVKKEYFSCFFGRGTWFEGLNKRHSVILSALCGFLALVACLYFFQIQPNTFWCKDIRPNVF